jgi:hypothetical protein
MSALTSMLGRESRETHGLRDNLGAVLLVDLDDLEGLCAVGAGLVVENGVCLCGNTEKILRQC